MTRVNVAQNINPQYRNHVIDAYITYQLIPNRVTKQLCSEKLISRIYQLFHTNVRHTTCELLSYRSGMEYDRTAFSQTIQPATRSYSKQGFAADDNNVLQKSSMTASLEETVVTDTTLPDTLSRHFYSRQRFALQNPGRSRMCADRRNDPAPVDV